MADKSFSLKDIGGPENLALYSYILPPITREVLELHYLQRMPLKNICRIINKSMTVVRNHHNRGIYRIKKYREKQLL